jgi:hypothetical protein
VAVAPDGRWVYVGQGDGSPVGGIHVFARDPGSGVLLHDHTFVGDGAGAIDSVNDIALSPDGRRLYVAQTRDDAVIVLDLGDDGGAPRIIQALYGGPGGDAGLGSPHDLALSPDGTDLYVASDRLVQLRRDAATGLLTAGAPIGYSGEGWYDQAWRVAVAGDGTRVYAGIFDYVSYARDAATGALTRLSKTQLRPDDPYGSGMSSSLATSPDGAMVLTVHPRDPRMFQAAPTPEGVQLVRTYANGEAGVAGMNSGTGLGWSPDGRFLYMVGATPGSLGSPISQGTITAFERVGDGLRESGTFEPQVTDIAGWSIDRLPGVSIEQGAIYTNDPDVTVRVTVPVLPSWSFRIANDPGFAGSALMKVGAWTEEHAWRLDTSGGPQRSVRRVYVRVTADARDRDTEVYSDDIILDQLAPRIVTARLKRSRLKLRARDNRSGVRRVQVTGNRRRPGAKRKFARSLRVSRKRRRLHVRVFDGAGNPSRWRVARR